MIMIVGNVASPRTGTKYIEEAVINTFTSVRSDLQ